MDICKELSVFVFWVGIEIMKDILMFFFYFSNVLILYIIMIVCDV